jgi:hypothetical protein
MLKATFYAVMMKRHAVPLSSLGARAPSQAPLRPIATTRL